MIAGFLAVLALALVLSLVLAAAAIVQSQTGSDGWTAVTLAGGLLILACFAGRWAR